MKAARDRGLITILDAKRGDIGVTAEHYAAAVFDGESGADAVTLNGYLGPDTILPFLRPGRGVYVLVRTSNPGSDSIQNAALAAGGTVATLIADMVANLGKSRMGGRGLSDVGAVVGATKSAEGAALRARMPDQVFLVPGYGVQGGGLGDIKPLVRARGAGSASAGALGVLVTASRSVIYAFEGKAGGWQGHIADAARVMRDELAALVG
jgi:orotidine-5'-phosphate decarboxylase